ncbi:hypothetical protein D3C81_2192590 [compost metagenome]
MALDFGIPTSSLAVAYLQARHEHVNVILGIRKERHLHENLAGADFRFPDGAIEEIDRLLNRLHLAAAGQGR